MRLNESKISNETENSNNAFQNRSMFSLLIEFDIIYDIDLNQFFEWNTTCGIINSYVLQYGMVP